MKAVDDKADELFVKLNEELKKHDWYYSFSDDHRYWVAGEAHWKTIQMIADELKEMGWDGHRLVKAYQDVNFNPGHGFVSIGWEVEDGA